MDNRLGITQIRKMKTMICISPVGPYYPRGFVPVKLYCDTSIVRAWPNGFGDKKVRGNYAPTLKIGRKGNKYIYFYQIFSTASTFTHYTFSNTLR